MNKKIYVTHTPSGFQWGLHPANTTALDVPISNPSQDEVHYEIVAFGPTKIFYRLPNGTSGQLRTGNGPEIEVPLGGKRTCNFSTSASGTYVAGVIAVVPFGK